MLRIGSRFIFLVPLLGVCILFVTACWKEDKPKISQPTTLDPYSESFWNRNIQYMLTEHPMGGYDTVTFDRSGNIIKIVAFGTTALRRTFQEGHFLIREWRGGDLPENCLITYHESDGLLIQTWQRLKTSMWGFDSDDIEILKKWHVIMVLNKSDQVAKEINLKDKLVVDYSYSNSRITRKREFDLSSETETLVTEYYYQDDGLLRISEFFDGESVPRRIHFFGSGTLDSTQLFSPTLELLQTTIYKFIYFESGKID